MTRVADQPFAPGNRVDSLQRPSELLATAVLSLSMHARHQITSNLGWINCRGGTNAYERTGAAKHQA